GTELHVSGWYAGLDQGVLEGEAAAEEKRDQVIPPHVADGGALLGELAFPVDAVAGHVGAKVGPRGGTNGLRITRTVISMIGHGLGFRVQNAASSAATSPGRITRFPG